jgi:hypothetical protein
VQAILQNAKMYEINIHQNLHRKKQTQIISLLKKEKNIYIESKYRKISKKKIIERDKPKLSTY